MDGHLVVHGKLLRLFSGDDLLATLPACIWLSERPEVNQRELVWRVHRADMGFRVFVLECPQVAVSGHVQGHAPGKTDGSMELDILEDDCERRTGLSGNQGPFLSMQLDMV